jgi:DNA-binding NarL/FixJ family response regulator
MAATGGPGNSAGTATITQETPMTQTLRALAPPDPNGSSDPAPIRVLIAEGHGLVRAGFRLLIERQEGMSVAAEAATGEEAVAEALRCRPDVVLMDVSLPGVDGFEATRRITADTAPGETRVVMLMAVESNDGVFRALRAGATGLLLKDADPGDLVAAVRAVADGEALLAPSLARRLVADFLSRPERLDSSPEELEELTAREREVMALVACGLSNDEIAERLVVTRATAKTHVSRALCKLHARDRAQLVVMAFESGLVRPGPGWAERADAAARFSEIARPPAGRHSLRPVAA